MREQIPAVDPARRRELDGALPRRRGAVHVEVAGGPARRREEDVRRVRPRPRRRRREADRAAAASASPPPRYAARSKSCTPRLTRTPLAHGLDGPTRRRSMARTVSSRTSLARARTTGLKRSECPTKRRAPNRAAALAVRASSGRWRTPASRRTRAALRARPVPTMAACDSMGVATMSDLRAARRLGLAPEARGSSGRRRVGARVVGAHDLEPPRKVPEHPRVALPHRAQADQGHLVTSRRPSAHSTRGPSAHAATYMPRSAPPRRAQKRSPGAAGFPYAAGEFEGFTDEVASRRS